MKKKIRTKKYYLLLIAGLLSITSLLCGATLVGISMNAPAGMKLNISIGSSTQLIPKKDEGYFLIQNQDQGTFVALLSQQGYVLQEQIFHTQYSEICHSNDYLYILMSNAAHTSSAEEKSSVITYNLSAAAVTDYHITELNTDVYSFTASRDGTIYGIDYWNRKNLIAYTNISDKDIAFPISLNTFETFLDKSCTDPNDNLYITLKNSIGTYTATTALGLPYYFTFVETNNIPSLSAHTLTNDLLLDRNYRLYNIHAGRFTLLSNTGYTKACPLTEHNILVAPESKDYLEELNTNGVTQRRYSIKGECIALATNPHDTGILLKQENDLYFLTLSELSRTEDIPDSSKPNSTSSTTNESDYENNNSSNSDASSPGYPYQLESDTFSIDRKNNTILLPPTTTFATLRNSLNSTKDTILMKNLSGTAINSGNLGTGYTVALQIDGSIVDKLTIVVKGDINGTGTVNSKDVQLLYAQLNGAETLSDIQLLACDINGDELIDTSDLLLLKQQIAFA